jgi:flagellar hook assembly protein FlgD
LGAAAPNPFHPSTEVVLDVPPLTGSASIAVRIYDVSGRLVRELHEGPLTAGAHRFRWDGRDAKGRGLAGGVYFLRANGPGFEAAEKLVLVR